MAKFSSPAGDSTAHDQTADMPNPSAKNPKSDETVERSVASIKTDGSAKEFTETCDSVEQKTPADTKVDEILARWQKTREQGAEASVEVLCADCPDFMPAVVERIRILKSMQGKLGMDFAKSPAESSGLGSFGDYDLIEEIARGGMGVVYKARQRALNRVVALKMILAGRLASEDAVKRFYKEARAAAALDHPNIVSIYDIKEEAGHHYFSMAFVEGVSLKGHIGKKGPLPAEEAARLMLPIVEAVEFAHRHNIIHRDLKPDNVLIDMQGRPRVTDFGLAKQVDEGDAGMTGAGQILGTPAYMSPEQAMGGKRKIGPPTDIYALGGILFFMLTGQSPFTGATVTEVLCKVVTEPARRPRLVNPKIPEGVDEVCSICLEKEPSKRYASAAALKQALLALISDPTATASRVSLAPTPTPVWRHPAWVVLALVVVVALSVAGWRLANPPATDVPVPQANPTAFTAEQEQKVLETWANDFGLKVEMIDHHPKGKNLREYVEGEPIKFRIETARDAYVGIWTIERNGTVTQIFPNEFEKNNFFKAGVLRTLPRDKVVLQATATDGVEEIQILASSRPWKAPDVKPKDGYLVFRGPQDQEHWTMVRRGIIVKAAAPGETTQAAREVIPYRVTKK